MNGGNGANGSPNGGGSVLVGQPGRITTGVTSQALEYQQQAVAAEQQKELTRSQIELEKQRIDLFRELSGMGATNPPYVEAINGMGLNRSILLLAGVGLIAYFLFFGKRKR